MDAIDKAREAVRDARAQRPQIREVENFVDKVARTIEGRS